MKDTGSDTDGAPAVALTRRQLLGAVVAGSATVAGCPAGDSGSETPSAAETPDDASDSGTPTSASTTAPTRVATETPSAQPAAPGTAVEPVFDLTPHSLPPENWDLSPYSSNVSARSYAIRPTLAPFGANASHPELDYQPLLMAENELVDGTTWRNTIAEGFTWHDSTPVTIDDRYYRAKYDNLRKKKLDKDYAFERVERVDDRTVELELVRPRVSAMFLSEHEPAVTHKASLFEPHLESMEDTTTKREAFLVHRELTNSSIPPEDWVGHGLFQVSDVTADRILYERYEDYPEKYRRRQNIETLRVPILSDGQVKDDLIVADRTDWRKHNVSALQADGEKPDTYRTPEKPSTKQYVFRLNHTNPHLARRGVRRALLYLQNWGYEIDGHISHYATVQDGTTPVMANYWIPDYEERTADYIDYGRTAVMEKAEAELRGAGYERNGDDMWVGPDGEVLSLTLYGDHIFDFEAPVTNWLTGVGIDFEFQQIGSVANKWKSYDEDWDVLFGFHSRGPKPRPSYHPAASYRNEERWGIKMWTTDESGNRVPVGNRRLEYEIPTEVGATDLSGETRTVNVADLQTTLTDPDSTREAVTEAARTLSWWWNFWLPDMVTFSWKDHYVGDYEHFEWRDWNGDGEGDASNEYELAYSLNAGYVHGKEA
jgi:ABC-type transport system substrate-binding protein